MLFSVYALFLFVLTTFVAAVPAGSRSRGNEATSVVTISLETEAAYVCDHGGIWTRQGSRSRGQRSIALQFTDVNFFAVLISNPVRIIANNVAVNGLKKDQKDELIGTWGRMVRPDDKMEIYYNTDRQLCMKKIIQSQADSRRNSRKSNPGQ